MWGNSRDFGHWIEEDRELKGCEKTRSLIVKRGLGIPQTEEMLMIAALF
jgi:hypothetical protein